MLRSPDTASASFAPFIAVLLAATLWPACSSRIDIPDLGPRLPQTAALELSESLMNAKADYTDNCGHLRVLDIGGTLEDAVTEATHRTFRSVVRPGSDAKADVYVRVKLVRSSFILRMDAQYDRAPAEIILGALASYHDAAGNVLGEEDIQVTYRDRVRLEAVQKNCDYVLEPFVHNAAVEFATKVSQGAASKVAAGSPATVQAKNPEPVKSPADPELPAGTPPVMAAKRTPTAISFKATVLDENGNLVFEGGERVRVRVDVVNAGEQEIQQVAATLSGTPSLIAQFPATTLWLGRLQPGQSRSLEFSATLPQAVQAQKAQLLVAVTDPNTDPPAPQTLSLSIQPTGVKTDDVDQIPASAAEFKRPHTYLLSVGIGSYRDQQLSSRRYGASDAELVATYFQSLGGVPASNVRLLQDWKALRPDLDEAVLDWLPAHVTKDAVVIIYFAGHATVSPAGEVFFVLYDGNTNTTSRAYPLKDLQAALGRLKVKQTVVLFDGVVSRLGSDGRGKGAPPQWSPSGSSSTFVVAVNGLGRSLEDEKHRHGLFTYYLLRALRGESDTNRDGEVTLAEALAYLSQKVAWASKAQFGQEQRPLVLPPLKNGDQSAALVLTKLAAISAAEGP
ncbi:MAG TPA: caspase family protein [Nitrospira sp.]|nr:caspase family protein [Nitrospira sp.]